MQISCLVLHGRPSCKSFHSYNELINWLVTAKQNYIHESGSSVGIATDYGLDGPGSNPGGDENFRPSRPALGPTQPPVKWAPGISQG